MAQAEIVVVDTNILFSALVREQAKFIEILLGSEHQL